MGSILKGTLYLEVFYALAIIIIHPTRSTAVYVLDISGTETPTGTAKCAGLRFCTVDPLWKMDAKQLVEKSCLTRPVLSSKSCPVCFFLSSF